MTKPRTVFFLVSLSAALIGSCTKPNEVESSDIPGFASSCSNQSACSGYNLICDGTVCVQCIDTTDCRTTEECTGGRCVSTLECSTADDCPRPLVCDGNLQVCVECAGDRDCRDGATCIASHCEAPNNANAGSSNTGNGGSSAGGSSSSGGGAGGTTDQGGTGQGGTGQGGTDQGQGGSAGVSEAGAASGGQAAGGSDNGGAAGASGGSVGNGGAGGMDPGPQYCDDKTQEAIPYNIQDDFIPYLLFGDIADVSLDDQTSCDGEAAPDATIFGCSAWEYSAVTGDHGGVAWSYPLNDFTVTMPGLCVNSGASEVEFYVRGEAGGEKILFGAGGGPRSVLTLTSGWTKHTVDLPSPPNTNTPGGVKEGFVWSATATDNPGGLRFYVGNITMK